MYTEHAMQGGVILSSSLKPSKEHHGNIVTERPWYYDPSLSGHGQSPETALVGAEADEGGGGALPAAALVVKLSATATSRGSYVVGLLAERYTVTISPAYIHSTQCRRKHQIGSSCKANALLVLLFHSLPVRECNEVPMYHR